VTPPCVWRACGWWGETPPYGFALAIPVIPAQAGTRSSPQHLGPRLRGDDTSGPLTMQDHPTRGQRPDRGGEGRSETVQRTVSAPNARSDKHRAGKGEPPCPWGVRRIRKRSSGPFSCRTPCATGRAGRSGAAQLEGE
jgi:hypothetical protein